MASPTWRLLSCSALRHSFRPPQDSIFGLRRLLLLPSDRGSERGILRFPARYSAYWPSQRACTASSHTSASSSSSRPVSTSSPLRRSNAQPARSRLAGTPSSRWKMRSMPMWLAMEPANGSVSVRSGWLRIMSHMASSMASRMRSCVRTGSCRSPSRRRAVLPGLKGFENLSMIAPSLALLIACSMPLTCVRLTGRAVEDYWHKATHHFGRELSSLRRATARAGARQLASYPFGWLTWRCASHRGRLHVVGKANLAGVHPQIRAAREGGAQPSRWAGRD